VGEAGMAKQMVRLAALLKLGLCLALGLATPAAAADDACRIAVLGDSLTSAYGLDVAQGFPAELERQLDAAGYRCTVLDAGVPGDTSAGGLARLDWMLGDRPSHVIVELGGNDALRGLPPEELERNLDAILARLQAQGIHVLLAGMLAPPNLGEDYGRAFAAVYQRVAAGHGVPLYRFFLDGVAGDPELIQPDGIHPTAEGIALIVRRILPTVEAWLGGGRPAESAR
jgi:acyl-CoA thioesterase I